jgi:hypothetical protein
MVTHTIATTHLIAMVTHLGRHGIPTGGDIPMEIGTIIIITTIMVITTMEGEVEEQQMLHPLLEGLVAQVHNRL